MREELVQILHDIRPDLDFEKAERLIDDEILDSFDIIQIVMEINEHFDIEIQVEDLQPVNLNNVQGMMELITRLQEE